MNIIIGGFIFIIGCVIGSFLNVCIYRIPKEESIAFPPSHCGSCGKNLKILDLIPILSWVFLKGKCRYCKEKISIQYPLVEVFTGVLFILLYFKFGLTITLLKYLIFTSLMVVIAIIDFKTEDVYTITTLFGVITGIIFIGIDYFLKINPSFLDGLIGGLIPALILALIVWITGAMGWGDVEIIFVTGLFLGIKLNFVTLFISIVIGGIVALILMVLKKRGGKDTMAFGPYIALAAYLSILVGEELLNLYINTFF